MAWVFNPFTGTFDQTGAGGGGGITSLTANTTPTTGFTAGQYMFSDGSVLKAGTFGTGVSTALGNAVNAASGLITFATFAPASGKSLTLNNTLTLSGTDGTTMTFPSTSATIARTDAGNTFTGNQVITEAVGGSGLTITGATQTTSQPVLNLTQTWNAGAVTFTGLKFNATDTASASGSLLLDIGTGGGSYVSRFYVNKSGSVFARSPVVENSTTSMVGVYNLIDNVGTGLKQVLYYSGANNRQFRINSITETTNPGLFMLFSNNLPTMLSSAESGAQGGGINFTNGLVIGNGAVVFGGLTVPNNSVALTGATATLQLGAADAAAPVAQFFKVQSGTAGASATTVSISGTSLTIAGTVTGTIAIGHAVTGTGVSAGTVITAGSGTSWTVNNSQTVGPITAYFNSVGADFTIRGSQGSGPSAGGSLIFQVAPAGSAATTAQNAYSTAFTISAGSAAPAPSLVLSRAIPSGLANVAATLASSSTATAGIHFGNTNVNDEVIIFAGNSPQFTVGGNGVTYTSILAIGASGGFRPTADVFLTRDTTNTLALRNGTNAQTFNVYGSYTSTTNYQRVVVKTLREVSSALSGASYTSTIQIPAYALLVGVTTRVNTAITGATSYSVGDGTTANLWGNNIGIALNSQSQTSDFTAVGAVGAAAAARSVTLTANGGNFTAGVVEICLHYLTTEAD